MKATQTAIQRTNWAPWPFYTNEEIRAVTDVLLSGKVNYWTGDICRLFEKEYAKAVGTNHAIALMNGTVALEAALYALNIGAGDEVITTTRTFIASASAAVMRGAMPRLADVDPDSQNITVETIKAVLTPNTKAIIVVHLAGWPCDMESICQFAKENNLFVIEDCAQAHGASIHGKQVGSFGDLAAYSFCQDKIISTGGEGGMLLTNNTELWEKIWAYKDHGKSYDAVYNREHPPGFRWLHDSFGTNWRMTEMQAAIGRIQLKKLPSWLRQRRNNAAVLYKCLSHFACLRIPVPSVHIEHSYYKFYVFVRPEQLKPGWDRDRLLREILAHGVPAFTGICSEIYLENAFVTNQMMPAERLPVAKELGDTSLMFLVHPTLTENDVLQMGTVIAEVMSEASLSF